MGFIKTLQLDVFDFEFIQHGVTRITDIE